MSFIVCYYFINATLAAPAAPASAGGDVASDDGDGDWPVRHEQTTASASVAVAGDDGEDAWPARQKRNAYKWVKKIANITRVKTVSPAFRAGLGLRGYWRLLRLVAEIGGCESSCFFS